MRNVLVSLLLSALLAGAGVGAFFFSIAAATTRSQEMRRQVSGQLDRAIESWEGAKSPASARRALFLVMGEPDSDLLEPPAPPSPLQPLLSRLRAGSLREEHLRRTAALAGAQGAVVLDWYEPGRVWADEKRRRRDALAVEIGKTRRAGARVVMIVDGAGASDAAAALREAPVSSADETLVDRLIVVGAEASDSARAAEFFDLWRSEGDVVTPAGVQLQRRDPSGRASRQVLEGEAGTPGGAAKLVAALAGGAPAAEALKSVGQTLAAPMIPTAPSASEPAAPGGPVSKRAAAPAAKPAASPGPLASIKADSAASLARPGTVPAGWHAERIVGPSGPIGWTIASPNDELSPHLAGRTTCADENALKTASGDALKPGCRVNVCLALYQDKLVGDVVNDAAEGSLISKVTPGNQFGHAGYFFVKSRPRQGASPAKDVYHYAISDRPMLIELRYELSGPDPAACGRPYFDVFDKAAHSIAPER